jgi:hypothetical protein
MTTKTTKTDNAADVSPTRAMVATALNLAANADKDASKSTATLAFAVAETFRNSNERIPAAVITGKDGKPGNVPMPRNLKELRTTKAQDVWNGMLKSMFLHFLGAMPDPHPKGTTHVERDPVALRKTSEMRLRRGLELAVALSTHDGCVFDRRTGVWTVPVAALCERGEKFAADVATVKLTGGTWYVTKVKTDGSGVALVKVSATIDRVLKCNPRALQVKQAPAGSSDDASKSGKGDTRDTTSEPLKASEVVARGKVSIVAAALRSMLSPDATTKGPDAAVFWSDLSDDDRNALERLAAQIATVKANGKRPDDVKKSA